jgi:hypothetical protein
LGLKVDQAPWSALPVAAMMPPDTKITQIKIP